MKYVPARDVTPARLESGLRSVTNPHDIQIGVAPGDVLAGKYRIERILAAGGMGVVVAAHHLQLDQRVALKFLLPEILSNPEAVARFVQEAQAAVPRSCRQVSPLPRTPRRPSA
jgi:serine/threonine protein kinase